MITINGSSITPADILKVSKPYTCMYTAEELLTFSQEKLDAIYSGILAAQRRGPSFRKPTLKELIGFGRRKGTRRKKKVA